jgi:putative Mn2+ efflux pump MntP
LTTTTLAALAHVVSTIVIGLIVGLIGIKLSQAATEIMSWISPSILIMMGLFFIWQHHRHHHFHIEAKLGDTATKRRIIYLLVVAMFFSPCLEVTALYFAAGNYGWTAVFAISVVYLVLTTLGMVAWVAIAYKGLQKWNWHALEHNAGIISGVTLVLAGLITLLL